MDEKEAEKKRSLRNEKLRADRTSETEEQRKESLDQLKLTDLARTMPKAPKIRLANDVKTQKLSGNGITKVTILTFQNLAKQ